ncbi:MAG TPA: PDZ domain-containing protein [Panacibacter sp.]|nr:PDZ domain-containing protein [Panacibacter sp.]HNP43782.1 PDZ domain-containing protein [Panacibacter sp.]
MCFYSAPKMLAQSRRMLLLSVSIIVFSATQSFAQKQDSRVHFTVSMEHPSTHYFHVEVNCSGFQGDSISFKMPAWAPGYYWIMNYSKNVINFKAADESGKQLACDKTGKNEWRVIKKTNVTVNISYDVYANVQSVADPFLDDSHAYIATGGILIYPKGQLKHDSYITIKPFSKWASVSTGLEPVKEQPFTYHANDFDELFDCPFYIGNQEILSFEVKGIRHEVAFENPANFETGKLLSDLKKMVEAASHVIGDIPYKHYSFLIMGDGRGGLEHRNSTAVFSSNNFYGQSDPESYKRWLGFLTHEYFHLYNIKSIRPIALGPFDYDKENLTHMLWVSEGFTVYYEYIILNRAGLMSKEDAYKAIQGNIKNYENVPGHLFQSATEASYDTWIQFFARGDNAANTMISYYDKGSALGALLDIAIRHETNNKRSLDDVMRTLYNTYYKQKKRGFTDDEFRKACELTAGKALPEIFSYASTTKDIDYKKYFGWAGLGIDTAARPLGSLSTGATMQLKNNQLVITAVEWNSPAWNAGLSSNDIVLKAAGVLIGKPADLEAVLKGKKAGDMLELIVSRRNKEMTFSVPLREKTERSFEISEIPQADPHWAGWLR